MDSDHGTRKFTRNLTAPAVRMPWSTAALCPILGIEFEVASNLGVGNFLVS